MYARESVKLNRLLLAKGGGHAATLLQPLVETLRRHVMSVTKLHANDMPVPMLQNWLYARLRSLMSHVGRK